MSEPEEIPNWLPKPPGMRFPPPVPVEEGWWEDPAHIDDLALRYHDGTKWTEFVCLVGWRMKGSVVRSPMPDAEG
jgi:hypothetical protein